MARAISSGASRAVSMITGGVGVAEALLHGRQHLVAVHDRHHHVQQHQRHRLPGQQRQGRLAAGRGHHLEAAQLQPAADDVAVVGDVVDHQDRLVDVDGLGRRRAGADPAHRRRARPNRDRPRLPLCSLMDRRLDSPMPGPTTAPAGLREWGRTPGVERDRPLSSEYRKGCGKAPSGMRHGARSGCAAVRGGVLGAPATAAGRRRARRRIGCICRRLG